MIAAILGGLLIGVSLGVLGSGGSILTVPILAYGVGHAGRVAIAESLAIVGGIALLGSLPYVRARDVSWRDVAWFGLPGMAGTSLGALAAARVSETTQLLAFAAVAGAAAVGMFRKGRSKPTGSGSPRGGRALGVVEGAGVGALPGFVGVGGGFLIVPALGLLRALPMRIAIGTSLVIIAMKSAAGFVTYLDVLEAEQLSVDWPTIGVFVARGTVGALGGGRGGRRLDAALLRQIFAGVLVLTAIAIVWRELG